MQYHLNGFQPGNPSKAHQELNPNRRQGCVDVLIVGCGPAGLTLAAQLSTFPDISTLIIERKQGPLEVGQADGIACRSIEMFEALGFAEKVLKESYWVNEVAFWRPEEGGENLHRANRIQDVEDDLSEMPHVILSQARIQDFYLDIMKKSPNRLEPHYSRELVSLTKTDDKNYPVTATFNCLDAKNKTETINARYVVGCDGARSMVRKSLGYELKGDSARQLWGVMDVLAITDFPDIRLKSVIQSAKHGSLLIIPREGGYLVRMYIELDELHGEERAQDRNVTSQSLIKKAQDILSPYSLEVKEVAWWSAYEIGQRVSDAFDDVPIGNANSNSPRIFIAGDACHTHSPKAGQGMNVSMADTYNLGWKLAAVLRKQSTPAILNTYSQERHAKAKELIDFDREMARLFSAKPTNATEVVQFQEYFKKHGRYTAGVETQYDPSLITGDNQHETLATGFKTGKRFHSAPVIRLGDGKPMQLGRVLKADGRWRLLAFAPTDDLGQASGDIAKLCEFLSSNAKSPIVRYTDKSSDIDSVIDVRAVFQAPHQDMKIQNLPSLLLPKKGAFGLIDYEKVFCSNLKDGPDIFDLRGIDRKKGALLIVRPDQYVAQVQPLCDFQVISKHFDKFMINN